MSEQKRHRRIERSDLRRKLSLNVTNDKKQSSFQRSGVHGSKRDVSPRDRSFERPTDFSTPCQDTFNARRSPIAKTFKSKIIEHLDSSTPSSSSASDRRHRHSKSSDSKKASRHKLFESSYESSPYLPSKTSSSRKLDRSRDSSRSSRDRRTNVTLDFEKLSSSGAHNERKQSERFLSCRYSSDESCSSKSDSETNGAEHVRDSYHSKSSEDIHYSDSYEATPGKRQRIDIGHQPANRSHEKDSFHSSKDEDFYKRRMVDQRKFVQRASDRRFDDDDEVRSRKKTTSSFTDTERTFPRTGFSSSSTNLLERKQRNVSTDNYHRRGFSDSWSTVSSPRIAGRKRLSDGHLLTSSSRSQSLGSASLFPREFKSPFYKNLNEDQLASARGALQQEMRSDVPYVDTHCHIDFLFKRLSFYNTMDEYMDQTFFKFPANFEGCIADWCQPSLYHQARNQLNATNSKFKLWGAFGCHPHFVQDYDDAVEKRIEDHIDKYDNVIAWGEMGLDYSDRFGPTDHALQKRVFARQLEVACKRNLPLVIHCRDADPDLLKIMKKHVPHDTKIHRHCLTTEEKDVRPLLDHFPNCYVGFTNLLTNRSAYRPRDAVAKIPLDRIVLETDAPYFLPRCATKESQALVKWSHPGMASSVACEIASIKDMDLDEVLLSVRDNVTRLYGI